MFYVTNFGAPIATQGHLILIVTKYSPHKRHRGIGNGGLLVPFSSFLFSQYKINFEPSVLLFSGGGGAGILATSALPGNKSQQRGFCVEIHVYECAAPGRAHRPFWHSARPVPSGSRDPVPERHG